MTGRATMILAAGFGTRMGHLTATRPKPLIEVAGTPLIAHALKAAGEAKPVVVNGHYKAEQLRDYLATHRPDVQFVEEKGQLLDSGGGIKNALSHLGQDPVMTLNADAVWGGLPPGVVLEQAWEPERMDALMLLVPRERAVGRRGGGDVTADVKGRLSWDRSVTSLVYTGAQILKTERLARHPEEVFSLREIWDGMMRDERLVGVIYPGLWADVGHPDGITEAEEMLRHAV